MIILVDYNNIPVAHRRRGLDYLADKIVRSIGIDYVKSHRHVLVRLYGGWYHLNKLTKEAQKLSTTVSNVFPRLLIFLDGSTKHIISVNIELAYSIAIEPSRHFWHTYRPRSLPPNLVCISPRIAGCKQSDCPLQVVYDFFKNQRCPNAQCAIGPEDILKRAEEKLVDTMITADMIYYANSNEQDLGIVTSDDDLWPGITMALIKGIRILHVQTHARRRTPAFYSWGFGNRYIQKNL